MAAESRRSAAPGKRKRSITDKQALFVEHYVQSLNATQSAIKAGYSAKSAEWQGYQLLQNPLVSAAISQYSEKRSQNIGLTTERLLQEAMRLAFFDIRKLVDGEGNPIPIQQLDDDTAAAIQGLELATEKSRDDDGVVTTVRKYKIADKNSAIERLFKHKGLFKADNDQANPGSAMAQFMAELSARGSRLPVKGSGKP
jgi:phage terminase small subunit